MQRTLRHPFTAAFASSSCKENGISCLARLNLTSWEDCRLRKGNKHLHIKICFMETKEQAEVVCGALGNTWGSEGVWGSWEQYLLSKGAARQNLKVMAQASCHKPRGLCWWLTGKVGKNTHHLVMVFLSNPCFVICVMIFMSNQPLIWGSRGAVEDVAEAAPNLDLGTAWNLLTVLWANKFCSGCNPCKVITKG